MILSAIVAKIRADTGLNAYPISAPPNTAPPYIVVNLESKDEVRHFGVGTGAETGIIYWDFEIQCYGKTPNVPIENSITLVAGLRNFTGLITGLDTNVYQVMDIEITGELTDYEKQRELFYQSTFITVATRS